MKVSLRNIPDEGTTLSKDIDPKGWDLSREGLSLVEAVRTRHQLAKQGEGEDYVQGTVSSVLSAECSRCLKPFPYRIHSAFHGVYLPQSQAPSGGDRALSHDAPDLYYYEGEEIDLKDELIGQLIMSVPMNLLCSADCRGLCPQCGQDLNLKRCGCKAEPDDVRWAGLKNIRLDPLQDRGAGNKENNAESKT